MPREAKTGFNTPHKAAVGPGGTEAYSVVQETSPPPVKKPHADDYQSVQDLREVNKWVMDIHPTVPNPYIPLNPLEHT